jgi:ribosome modulation factor
LADIRYTQLFNEGYAACRAGKSNIDNPYSEDGDQEAWNDGWFERVDDEAEAAEMGAF